MFDVYAIATGSTVSGGLFIVPGLAAAEIGNSFVLAYFISAILVIPSILSKIELATAMPRAGGVYYFLDRSLGPLIGTIGGVGVWLVLILKVSFALVGIGAYLSLFFKGFSITPIAITLAILLGILNFFGAKKSSSLQIVLVLSLILILTIFIASGVSHVNVQNFQGIFDFEFLDLISTSGLVFISYVGVTKIASLSEEITNPEKNIPLGIFLALGTAFIIYVLGTLIILGVLPISEISNNLTAPASVQKLVFGTPGVVIISAAAIIAFISVANSGIMSASRYPLAMSRDHIFPGFLRKLTRFDTPAFSLYLTVGIIALVLIIFDPTKIAKLASTFQLLVFAFICVAVIVMRESRIESYDPGYKSPFYPWTQIFGILGSLFLITQLGILSIIFSFGLILVGFIWYWKYSRLRVTRNGAIYHIFERLGKLRYSGLDSELRGILKEKGLRKDDPFDEIIHRSVVFDINEKSDFETVVGQVARRMEYTLKLDHSEIIARIMEGTRVGATPVTHSFALPHFRLDTIEHPEIVLVRSNAGIEIEVFDPLTHKVEEVKTVRGLFFLCSPENNPTQHLRILAKIAGRVDDDDFMIKWESAKDEHEIQEALLYDEQFLTIHITTMDKTKDLIGEQIRSVKIPDGCLITTIRRGQNTIIPKGNTQLMEEDRLIILGDAQGIAELRTQYYK